MIETSKLEFRRSRHLLSNNLNPRADCDKGDAPSKHSSELSSVERACEMTESLLILMPLFPLGPAVHVQRKQESHCCACGCRQVAHPRASGRRRTFVVSAPRDLARAVDNGLLEAWDYAGPTRRRGPGRHWLSIPQRAAEHGTYYKAVRNMIAAGELNGVQDSFDRRWVLERIG